MLARIINTISAHYPGKTDEYMTYMLIKESCGSAVCVVNANEAINRASAAEGASTFVCYMLPGLLPQPAV